MSLPTRQRPTGRAAALVLLLAALLVSCDSSPATALSPTVLPPTATPALPPTVAPVPSATAPPAPTVVSPTATVPAAPSATLPPTLTMVMIAPTSPPAGPTPPVVSGTVTIQIVDFYFAPAVITVPLGTKIVWTNIGPTEHTVADLTMHVFSSDILQKGDSFSWTPDRVGTIPYWCTIHPDMRATLIVTR